MYLVVIHALISIGFTKVIATTRYRTHDDDILCHITPHLKCQTVFIPSHWLTYTCIAHVSIDVYKYMLVYRHVFTLSYSSALCYSFWTHAHANMPYFARAGWGPLDVGLILQHNDMFARIRLSILYLQAFHRVQGCFMVRYLFPTISQKLWLHLYDTVLTLRA